MRAMAVLTPTARLRRRIAAGALLVSAPVNAVGVVALVAMYIGFAISERSTAMALGRTNDILGLVGAALMAPAVIEIHALTGPDRRVVRVTLVVAGVGAIATIVWLQYLLVTERLTFEQQIGTVVLRQQPREGRFSTADRALHDDVTVFHRQLLRKV